MKNLLHNHYVLIQKRGLISNETTLHDFMDKLEEEYLEVMNAYADLVSIGQSRPDANLKAELTDLVMVVMNCFERLGIDFRDELKRNIQVQEGRI